MINHHLKESLSGSSLDALELKVLVGNQGADVGHLVVGSGLVHLKEGLEAHSKGQKDAKAKQPPSRGQDTSREGLKNDGITVRIWGEKG